MYGFVNCLCLFELFGNAVDIFCRLLLMYRRCSMALELKKKIIYCEFTETTSPSFLPNLQCTVSEQALVKHTTVIKYIYKHKIRSFKKYLEPTSTFAH